MEGPSGNPFPSQPLIGKLQRSMISQKLQKKRARIAEKLQKRRAQVAENKVKAKRRSRVNPVLPVRLTSCIFTTPVTRMTSHPGNKTMCRQEEEKLMKPLQLCAFRRLQDHQIEDTEEEQLHPLDLTNCVQRTVLGTQAGARVPRAADGQHTCPPEFTSAQPPSSEKNMQGTPALSPPSFYNRGVTTAVALQLSPSFYRQGVTTADIRRQTRRVNNARKKLAEALEADRLARQAESIGEWNTAECSEN